ncbi:MAG: aminotransferase class I/II-fold pyridoxal phosphate-dependent enzyme [Kineosporiaceae bacterium]|nr:aminotransferase class I/II-fold pyridoxal phosphate-dependent enzyme [Kineosporiaceae bacterium]
MSEQARARAAALMARLSTGTADAAPGSAAPGRAAAGSLAGSLAGSVVPTSAGLRRIRRLEDLPQVRQSLDRDAALAAGVGEVGLHSPYYRSHEGVNGATISLDGQELVNFSSYNYLGLADHPAMLAASHEAIERYGTTSGATRIVSGNIGLHDELERTIAESLGVQDATTVGSGFLTNASVISFVLGEGDVAICDALVHNSIVAGTLWSHCRRMQFTHNDPVALDVLLSRVRPHFGTALVILEGVYSMDGDIGALPDLIEVCRRHEALVMVDEAHSFAVLGRTGLGVREHFGLAPDAVDIWMGTLSKALASHGGYVAGSHEFVQACRMSAPGMSLYAAGLTPATAASALTAIRLVRAEPERLARLRANSVHFLTAARAAGLDTGPSQDTPIIPIMLGSSRRAMACAVALAAQGVNANPILYPAVPDGEARLRFFLSSEHTTEQLDQAIATLVAVLAVVDAGAFPGA